MDSINKGLAPRAFKQSSVTQFDVKLFSYLQRLSGFLQIGAFRSMALRKSGDEH